MGGNSGCKTFINEFYKNKNIDGFKNIKLKDLSGKTIAVDIMIFIYRAMLRSKKLWKHDIIFLISI